MIAAASRSISARGRTRCRRRRAGTKSTLHSLPGYYGYYVGNLVRLPALAVMLLWMVARAARHRCAGRRAAAGGRSELSAGRAESADQRHPNLATGNIVSGDVDAAVLRGAANYAILEPSARWVAFRSCSRSAGGILGSCLRLAAHPADLRARNRVERIVMVHADRRLEYRHPHHHRHRAVGACSRRSASSEGAAHRVPVRPGMEPADGAARRPGRFVRRLRRGAAVRRYAADHG